MVVRFPPWAIGNNSLGDGIRLVVGMLISLILLILINRALKNNSKDCEFNLEITIKDFKIYFKAKEKNAPSSQD